MMSSTERAENLTSGAILYVGSCLRLTDCRFKEDPCVSSLFIGALVDILRLNLLALLTPSVGPPDPDPRDRKLGVMLFLRSPRDIFNTGSDILTLGLIESRCSLEPLGGAVKLLLCLDILSILWSLILGSHMNDEQGPRIRAQIYVW